MLERLLFALACAVAGIKLTPIVCKALGFVLSFILFRFPKGCKALEFCVDGTEKEPE